MHWLAGPQEVSAAIVAPVAKLYLRSSGGLSTKDHRLFSQMFSPFTYMVPVTEPTRIYKNLKE